MVMITMETDNIEATIEKVTQNGGKAIRERYEVSPEIGHAAEFEDVFGNRWGLHQSP
jgi:predicted enzyme related to lactoylglutathione lyase